MDEDSFIFFQIGNDKLNLHTPLMFFNHFGMDCEDVTYFYESYIESTGYSQVDFLWFIDWIVNYNPNWQQHSSRWNVSHNTFENTVLEILRFSTLLHEV